MVLTTITLTSTAPIFITASTIPLPPLPAPSPWPSQGSFTTITSSAQTTITATPGQTLSVYPQPLSPVPPSVPSPFPPESTNAGTVTEVDGIIVVVDASRVITATIDEAEPWTTISYTATWLPSISLAPTATSILTATEPSLAETTDTTGTSTVYITTTSPLPLFTYVLPTPTPRPFSSSLNGSGWSSWSAGHRAGAIMGTVLGFLLLLALMLVCCLRMLNGNGKGAWAASNWNHPWGGWGHRGPVGSVQPGLGVVGPVGTGMGMGHPGWGRYGY